MTPEELAKQFHATYERLAPKFGYETRPQSRVEWEQVPEQNKMLMIATAAEVLAWLHSELVRRELMILGDVKNGDVVIVRYVGQATPDLDARKKDYIAIRDYFQKGGTTVRMLGISGDMTLDLADELEMARFGWFKRR